MTRKKKLGCPRAPTPRVKNYFADLRGSTHGNRGAAELIEGLADLGAPASVVAEYLATHAEIVIRWHDTDAQLPALIWDSMLDLAGIVITVAESRFARHVAGNNCPCIRCVRRKTAAEQSGLTKVFREIAGVGDKYAES